MTKAVNEKGWVCYPDVVLYVYPAWDTGTDAAHGFPPRDPKTGRPRHEIVWCERILDVSEYERLRSSGALLATEHTGHHRPTWANPHERTR